MNSSAGVSVELRIHSRHQEAIADLSKRTLETNDLGQSMPDASATVAWNGIFAGSPMESTDLDSQAGYTSEVWVDSEPDEGSTFSFTLPAVDETERDVDA